MKKQLSFMLFTAIILTACNTSTLSFSEIEVVPDNVQEKIDSNYTLQMMTESEETSYIVFQSKGPVATNTETQGDTLTIMFDETNQDDEALVQHVYKLTTDPDHDTIDVFVNGQSVPFDTVTGL